MLNMTLPLQLEQGLTKETGERVCRGLMHVINAVPLQLDPSESLLHPDESALHTARPIAVPIGDHASPGYMFTPRSGTGATVCLVHGTTAEKPLPYFYIIRGLLKAGLQVMTFELDGHGANPRPLCYPGLDQNVPAALAFLRDQPGVDPKRIGMVGVSLGGACILNAAARVGGIKAIATVSTPHSLKMDDLAKVLEAITTLSLEMLPTVLEAAPNKVLSFVSSPMRLADSLAHPHEEVDLLHPKTLTFINHVIRQLNPLDSVAELRQTPVLVMNGSWDNITPSWQARDLYERAAGPKALAVIPRRNHFTIMASHQAVTTVVDWFRRWL